MAPTLMITCTTSGAFKPRANSYTIGTMKNRTSCFESLKLARGSLENAAETSVMAAYATSGTKKSGASNTARRAASRSSHIKSATERKILASAMENCSAATNARSAPKPMRSSRSLPAVSARAAATVAINVVPG